MGDDEIRECDLWQLVCARRSAAAGASGAIGTGSVRSIFGDGSFIVTACTPALALCAAFCHAMAKKVEVGQ